MRKITCKQLTRILENTCTYFQGFRRFWARQDMDSVRGNKRGMLALHVGRLQTDVEEWIRTLHVDTDQKAWIGKVNSELQRKKILQWDYFRSQCSLIYNFKLCQTRYCNTVFYSFSFPGTITFHNSASQSEHLKSFYMKAFGWSEDSKIFQTISKCRHVTYWDLLKKIHHNLPTFKPHLAIQTTTTNCLDAIAARQKEQKALMALTAPGNDNEK